MYARLSLPLFALLALSATAMTACPAPGGSSSTPTWGDLTFGTDNGTTSDGTTTTDDGPNDSSSQPDVLPTNIPCTTDQNCPAQVPYCGDDGYCKECLSGNDCTEGTCESGFCLSESCTPDETRCDGPSTQLICNATGTGWIQAPCTSGFCAAGQCTLCEPDAVVCQGFKVVQCSTDGQGSTEIEDCQTQGSICIEGSCRACAPGQPQCNGDVREVCNEQGQWVVDQDCAAIGSQCQLGQCLDPCELEVKDSNAGCDYYAVNLDNISSAITAPNYQYSVVIANTQEASVTVTVFQKTSAAGAEVEIQNRTVAGGALEVINLPTNVNNASGIFYNAYRIKSTGPIIAAQFNPLENVEVYSNDASLLLPANTFGYEYIVSSRNEFLSGDGVQWRGFATVVASQEATTVTVTPSVNLLGGSGVQAMNAGQTYQVTINPYEVLNLKSNQDGADMTGTIISADKPIGVYSGHDAAITSNQCCADHLEQQLFPVETWGLEYVGGKSFPRGVESDYWRIIASEDNTTVVFAPTSVEPLHTLNRGEYFEFSTTQDFVITADKPVMVTQTLASSQETLANTDCNVDSDCGDGGVCLGALPPLFPGQCQGIGDPAMILAPPASQWRNEYVFLAPSKFYKDYVNILAPSGASVTLDGNVVPTGNFQAIPGTGYKVGRILVNDGVHNLTATEPVGLISYGYDLDVSYGYTAGLNLESSE